MEYITLKNNIKIPQLGFGVFQIPPEETKEAVLLALKTGYRHFDTAEAYFNEEAIGQAIKESGIPREELFLTTKVFPYSYGYETTKQAFKNSLEKLQTDYIDLYLLHQNTGDIYSTWKAVEELYEEGKAKAIGVCNFSESRFTDLALHSKITPMVNQIEINPYYQQQGTEQFHEEKFGTKIEAWGPLAEGRNNIFNNPTLTKIAEKHNKSTAQIILRWIIQRGIIVFPKSTKEERMQQNFNIFDFELTKEDMEKIKELETGEPIADINSPAFIEMLSQF